MTLNAAGLALAGTALQTGLLYAQLHSAAAGGAGTSNVCSVRVLVYWGPITAGAFTTLSAIKFTGGTPYGPVYSVSLWDSQTLGAGTFYGEYPLSGDLVFNGQGEYQVTAINFTGTAT